MSEETEMNEGHFSAPHRFTLCCLCIFSYLNDVIEAGAITGSMPAKFKQDAHMRKG